jgi:hypothetical protein
MENQQFYEKAQKDLEGKDKQKNWFKALVTTFMTWLVCGLLAAPVGYGVYSIVSDQQEKFNFIDTGISCEESKHYLGGAWFRKDAINIENNEIIFLKKSNFNNVEKVVIPYDKLKEVSFVALPYDYRIGFKYGEGFLSEHKFSIYVKNKNVFELLRSELMAHKDKFMVIEETKFL